MQTSIVESVLPDGSKSYAVVFVDGSQKAVITAYDRSAAIQLSFNFSRYALSATIDPN